MDGVGAFDLSYVQCYQWEGKMYVWLLNFSFEMKMSFMFDNRPKFVFLHLSREHPFST